jgi:hypothetical protein
MNAGEGRTDRVAQRRGSHGPRRRAPGRSHSSSGHRHRSRSRSPSGVVVNGQALPAATVRTLEQACGCRSRRVATGTTRCPVPGA